LPWGEAWGWRAAQLQRPGTLRGQDPRHPRVCGPVGGEATREMVTKRRAERPLHRRSPHRRASPSR
jgi:hypothetical protein